MLVMFKDYGHGETAPMWTYNRAMKVWSEKNSMMMCVRIGSVDEEEWKEPSARKIV